jgi:glycosyltransferase involved in cell wall biosynthesis
VPVVATKAGGIPELVEHMVNGLLVDSHVLRCSYCGPYDISYPVYLQVVDPELMSCRIRWFVIDFCYTR